MKPTIGRIVLVKHGVHVLPAIIVRVWSDICINVVAFHDGSNDFPENNGETIWLGSVLFESSSDATEPMEHHWIWPVRD